MHESLIRPIPLDLKHDWRVTLNGQPDVISEFVAVHAKLGALSWGLRPEGTVGWVWAEIGGGGVGTVPYFIMDSQLMIGMVQQDRATMAGGVAWNIPRGFLEPGLTHFESAKRETEEELGVKELNGGLKALPGDPANSNSTFFDTRGGDGFRFYGLHVPQSLLDCSRQNPVFRHGLFVPKPGVAERIMKCQFVHWRAAARVADTFTNAGVARLIASDDLFLHCLRFAPPKLFAGDRGYS